MILSRKLLRQSPLVPMTVGCLVRRALLVSGSWSGIEKDFVLTRVGVVLVPRADLVESRPDTDLSEGSDWLKPLGRTTGKL